MCCHEIIGAAKYNLELTSRFYQLKSREKKKSERMVEPQKQFSDGEGEDQDNDNWDDGDNDDWDESDENEAISGVDFD